MLDLMPKRYIKHSEINNWNMYADGLNEFPYVKKYTEEIFKKWIANLQNPLANRWIKKLFTKNLDIFDTRLYEIENQIGEKNLLAFFEELYCENSESEKLYTKIDSIWGEILAFSEIAKVGYKSIEKIPRIGDIERDNSIFSVKTILDLDVNYQIIEETIRGISFIEENAIIRKYNYVKFSDGENIDYDFLSSISDFINHSLVDTLDYLTKQKDQEYIKIEIFKSMFYKIHNTQSLLEAKIYSHFTNDISYIIELSEKRYQSKNKNHRIKFQFTDDLKQQKNFYYVSYDTNTYFEGNEISKIFLKNRITEKINEFDRSFVNVLKEKKFIGWINISIHPQHENFVINNKQKFKSIINSIIGKNPYKVIVFLIPQFGFDLKNSLFLEFDENNSK